MVKITKIYIKHFRSIIEEEFLVDNFNVFVGLNDAGKSNVLKALDLFFNYKPDTFNFFDNYSSLVHLKGHRAKEIVIAITFEIPKQYTDHGAITLTKKWAWTQTKGVMFSDEYDRTFSTKARTSVLLERIMYEYIPAVKSKDYFKDLLLEMYNTMLTVANSELREVTDNYSDKLKELTEGLSETIREKLNIDSYIKMPEDLATLFRDLLFETKDAEGNSIKLFARGDGIQARHIPFILKFIYDKKTTDAVKRSVPCTVIWGYEEPENGVELGACFDLVQELLNYSNEIQMFITSHSPAFYSVHSNEHSNVYLTYKENNHSKYMPSPELNKVDAYMGLMPIIQPYVQQAIEEHKKKEGEIKALKDNIINELKRKLDDESKPTIVLITEGTSDAIHLETAFSHIPDLDNDIISRLSYYDFQVESTLGDKLNNVLNSFSATPIKKTIIIGIYDRDKTIIENDRGKQYRSIGNNVFKFNIPALSNSERAIDDKISIEHYFSNAEIKKEFSNGRLYMANDFDQFGMSLDRNWSFTGFSKNTNLKSYSIIDINNKHIERKSAVGKMASKVQFAEYVKCNPSEFDFNNFIFIYNVIKAIFNDVCGK